MSWIGLPRRSASCQPSISSAARLRNVRRPSTSIAPTPSPRFWVTDRTKARRSSLLALGGPEPSLLVFTSVPSVEPAAPAMDDALRLHHPRGFGWVGSTPPPSRGSKERETPKWLSPRSHCTKGGFRPEVDPRPPSHRSERCPKPHIPAATYT